MEETPSSFAAELEAAGAFDMPDWFKKSLGPDPALKEKNLFSDVPEVKTPAPKRRKKRVTKAKADDLPS